MWLYLTANKHTPGILHTVAVSGHQSSSTGSSNIDPCRFDASSASSQIWERVSHVETKFRQWNSDHISVPLTDLMAVLLDMATKHHPSVLTSFSLNISLLSQEGLPYLQNIFQRSDLGHLHVYCTVFNPSLKDFVRQVLLSIQWVMLLSLTSLAPPLTSGSCFWQASQDHLCWICSCNVLGSEEQAGSL